MGSQTSLCQKLQQWLPVVVLAIERITIESKADTINSDLRRVFMQAKSTSLIAQRLKNTIRGVKQLSMARKDYGIAYT